MDQVWQPRPRARRIVARDPNGQPRTYRLDRLPRPSAQPAAYRRLAVAILGLDVSHLAAELRAARLARIDLARAA